MSFNFFHYPRVLSIAGSDSGGGAGIQADLKTLSALGCYGMTAITALTAQNTCGVTAVEAVSAQMLGQQIDAVVQDIGVDAVKIGMIPSVELMQVVVDAIDAHRLKNVVLDTVMASTSGTTLMQAQAVRLMAQALFARVTVITPNLQEAALLSGRDITTPSEMEVAAQALMAMGAKAVVLKGGHLAGDEVADLLQTTTTGPIWMRGPRIDSANSHGTGCTLSSAIAAGLACGLDLASAVLQARDFVRGALLGGAAVTTGRGIGPLNHGYAPVSMRLRSPM